jgi:transposase
MMEAQKEYEKLSRKDSYNRSFSEDFKRRKVTEIDRNLVTISELCREYQISRTSVYKWVYLYSKMKKKGIKQVIESKSDSRKLLEQQAEIKELQRIIGQKQILLDFKDKMIELAEGEFGIDIKKKFSGEPSFGTGTIKKPTKSK